MPVQFLGSEILVNTATVFDQVKFQEARLSNGGFVVTWVDDSRGVGGAIGDTSSSAIKAQVFSASGAKIGSEILVNTATLNNQTNPRITALNNGGFVITWDDPSQGVGGATGDASNIAVKAQVFTADGAKVSSEILVNTATLDSQNNSQVIALSDGGFIVTWDDFSHVGGDTSVWAVKGQIFGANGTKTGSEILVNTAVVGGQQNSAVALLANGSFVVTWTDDAGDNNGTSVKAQVFAANGARVGGEILVNTATFNSQIYQQIVPLSNGGFVIAWDDYSTGVGGGTGDASGGAVKAQVFATDGTKVGSEILVNTAVLGDQLLLSQGDAYRPFNDAQIAALEGGGFAVTWGDLSQGNGGATGDVSSKAVKAQVFAANGAKVGGEILVNTTTVNYQGDPQITAVDGGGFVIVWQDNSGIGGDASSIAVKGQEFDSSGAKIGGEFLANTAAVGAQEFPHIVSVNGGFVVIWDDRSGGVGGASGDSSGGAIKAQVFPLNRAPIDIALSNDSVLEHAPGVSVGTLSAIDPDNGDTPTFAIVAGTSNAAIAASTSLTLVNNGSASRVVDGIVPPEGSSWFDAGAPWQAIPTPPAGSTTTPITIALGGTFKLDDLLLSIDNNDRYLIEYSRDGGSTFQTLVTVLEGMGEMQGGMETVSTVGGNPEYVAGLDFASVFATHLRISASGADGIYAVGEVQPIGTPLGISATFEIVNGNELRLRPDIALDAALTPTLPVTVMAMDPAGGTYQETLTVNVTGVNEAPTFSVGDGKVTTPIGTSEDQGNSVTLQPDGKILVAGYSNNVTNGLDFALVRYNANGSLDATFDGDGKLTTPISSSTDVVQSVTLQPDGKILVAGYSQNGPNNDFALVRYNANGSLDTTFDGDGKLTTPIGTSDDVAQSVTLQPDGKILVAGYSLNGPNYDFSLVRYNANGSLDTTFDGDGKLTMPIGTSNDLGYSVTLQPDGKILVAGYSHNGTNADFALVRYNANGSLDTTFDGDGKLTTPIGTADDVGYSVTLQPDGKILVAGYSHNGTNADFALVRYNANGSLDTTFDGDGKLTTPIGTSDDVGYSVTLQPDGKILVAGYSYDGTNYDFALVRYNANGSLDTTFDGDGKLTTPIGTFTDIARSVTLQPDGKILVAGYSQNSNNDFALVRYNSDGSLDLTFDGVNTLNGAPTYTENGPAVVLDSSVSVYDAELSAAGNYGGATLTLARSGGSNAEDVFGASGNLSFSGGNVALSGNAIGLVTQNSAGTLVLTFNTSATQAQVNAALGAITYANTSDTPPASATISWTFSDGNSGAQGTGGPLAAIGSTTVSIVASNDAPVLDLNGPDGGTGVTSGFTENEAAITIAPFATIVDADSANFDGGILNIGVQTNGTPTDQLAIKNQGMGPGQIGISGNTVIYGGVSIGTFTGGVNGGNLVIFFNAAATPAAVQALAENILYSNTSDDPTFAQRTLSLVLEDGDGGSTTSLATIDVTPVNDAPSGADKTITLNEDGTYIFKLSDFGYSDLEFDNIQSVLIHTLSLPNGAILTLAGSPVGLGMPIPAGQIRDGDLAFSPATNENGAFYASFTFQVRDVGGTANGGADTDLTSNTISINVTPINDAPVITSAATFSVAENTTAVGTVTATDADSPMVTFAITGGADAALFAIDADSGALSFVSARDYESQAPSYQVEVTASDGSNASTPQLITVTLTDVNDNAPVITSAATFSVAENTTAVGTVTATDADSPTVTFAITGGADAALFAIDADSGALSFVSARDYESQAPSYQVEVTASDGSNASTPQLITVTLTDVNDNAPVITSAATFSVAENTTAVGTVTATDADSPTVTFAITGGADAALFAIDADSGALSFVSARDYESQAPSYQVEVTASDGSNASTPQLITVTLTDVNDNAPVIISAATFSVAENTTAVGTVTATDADSPTVTFAITGGADAALFAIDADSGALSFVSARDYESQAPSYQVEVTASDGSNASTPQLITVTLTDVNDNAPVIISAATFSVAENTTAVGTVTATDADSPTVTFAITGGADAALFAIDADSGALSFVSARDYESQAPSYQVEVTASDGSNASTPQLITVTLTDVNDNAPVITSAATFSVAENTTAVGTVTATDADSPTVTFAITGGADAALFAIDADSGALSFVSARDYESQAPSYQVEVTASDGSNASTPQLITVTLTDVNDNAPVIISAATFSVAENTTAVGTVTATDADSPTVTFAITGGADAALFAIDADSGALSFVSARDYESQAPSYQVEVTASDGSNASTPQLITVTLTDVNETPTNVPPSITSNGAGATTAISRPENSTAVTTVTATDTNSGDTLTYSIVGGADAAKFDIDPGTGLLVFKAAPNFENKTDVGANNVYDVIVQVSDGHDGTDTQAIAVTVTDVSEPTNGGSTLNFVVNGTGNNQTVKLTDTAITDGDLVTAANPTGTASPTYQWQFSSNGGTTWTNIAGATAVNYTPTGANVDRPVHVLATYVDASGPHMVTSQAAEIGNSNANTLQGTIGADLLIGLNGNDTYTVNTAGDQVTEATGGGNDAVQTSLATYILATNVENLTFIGANTNASFTWTGNALANTITAGGGNDTLEGGAGNDDLNGGSGNDTAVFSGSVADHLFTNANGRIVITSAADGTDTLSNIENVQFGANTFHLVAGNGQANTLQGTSVADLFLGFGGNDTASYANSSSAVTASLLTPAQNTGDAAGDLYDSIRNLTGGSGNDRLTGNSVSNTLSGGGGNDTIEGGAGNDTLIGGSGIGNDTFVFRPGFGKDTVTDFQIGTAANHDTLDLGGLGFTSVADMLSHTDAGANAVIHVGSDTITLQGVTKAQLQSHAFDLLIS